MSRFQPSMRLVSNILWIQRARRGPTHLLLLNGALLPKLRCARSRVSPGDHRRSSPIFLPANSAVPSLIPMAMREDSLRHSGRRYIHLIPVVVSRHDSEPIPLDLLTQILRTSTRAERKKWETPDLYPTSQRQGLFAILRFMQKKVTKVKLDRLEPDLPAAPHVPHSRQLPACCQPFILHLGAV